MAPAAMLIEKENPDPVRMNSTNKMDVSLTMPKRRNSGNNYDSRDANHNYYSNNGSSSIVGIQNCSSSSSGGSSSICSSSNRSNFNNNNNRGSASLPLIDMVSLEIEQMRLANEEHQNTKRNKFGNNTNNTQRHDSPTKEKHHLQKYHSFPPGCLRLLQSLEGNCKCVDCGQLDPQWAAVSYGALLCLQCSGFHRSLGVATSCVRSISMDEWSLEHVLAMLEGGNGQLDGFFTRHHLTERSLSAEQMKTNITKDNVTRLRYKTKAALFYRQQMQIHIARLLQNPEPYRSRCRVSRTKSAPVRLQPRNHQHGGGGHAGGTSVGIVVASRGMGGTSGTTTAIIGKNGSHHHHLNTTVE